jgi:DNA-binding HxlR family transcriptional regulator
LLSNSFSLLALLATPSTSGLLPELVSGPRSLADLRQDRAPIPETTLRGHLRALALAGAVEKRRHGGFPGSVDYRLTEAGDELKAVAEVLADWLKAAPQGEAPLGSDAAKHAVRVLLESWRAGIVHALAFAPISLTELAGHIDGLSYPAVERRLAAMRRLGLARAAPGASRSKPLAVTPWLQRAILPLAAAHSWQRRWHPATARVARRDVEAMFLLALPAQPLPEAISGSCRLTLRSDAAERDTGLAGITAEITSGVVVPRMGDLAAPATATLEGSSGAWTSALVGVGPGMLEAGGETSLAAALLDQIRKELRSR